MRDNIYFKEYLKNLTNSSNIIALKLISKLILKIINDLRVNIEDENVEEISWKNPFIKFEYPLEIDINGNENIFINNEEENEKQINFIEKNIEKNYMVIFKEITKNINIVRENEKSNANIPEEILNELKNLTFEEQSSKLELYLKIESLIIKYDEEKPFINISFYPLVIDKNENKKFFTVIAKIDCKNFKPEKWALKTKNEFWENIIKEVNYILPNEDNLISVETPKQEIKILNPKNKLIKTSLHTELQKFGKKPKPNQKSFFDLLEPIDDETKNEIIKYQIDVIGIDNTQAQNQALFSIQKLLSEKDYKSTDNKKLSNEDNSFKFNGYLPAIKFTPNEYLEAYGVNKRKTSRGKEEYNANERVEAFKALTELSNKRYLFFYEKKYWKDGKEFYDVIKTVRPILNIVEGYESLSLEERDNLKNKNDILSEKLKFIVVEPCPLLVEQINSYFVLKPANCYQEIRLLVGKTIKYVPLFIDYLRTEVTKREISAKGNEINWSIEISSENLAYKLRMDKLIKEYKSKRIREYFLKCYEIAKELEYIKSYETIKKDDKEIEIFVLNPYKFRKVNQIDQELRKIEANL